MSGCVLGEKYRDSISGYEGVCTGRAEYLYGCVQVCLSGGDAGKPTTEWFDEQRVTLDSPAGPGGPTIAPTRERAPS